MYLEGNKNLLSAVEKYVQSCWNTYAITRLDAIAN